MTDDARSRWPAIRKYVFAGFVLIAGYFLITEHRAHLVSALSYLPYLLLLACPLMHLFHRHGDHRGHGEDENKSSGHQHH